MPVSSPFVKCRCILCRHGRCCFRTTCPMLAVLAMRCGTHSSRQHQAVPPKLQDGPADPIRCPAGTARHRKGATQPGLWIVILDELDGLLERAADLRVRFLESLPATCAVFECARPRALPELRCCIFFFRPVQGPTRHCRRAMSLTVFAQQVERRRRSWGGCWRWRGSRARGCCCWASPTRWTSSCAASPTWTSRCDFREPDSHSGGCATSHCQRASR